MLTFIGISFRYGDFIKYSKIKSCWQLAISTHVSCSEILPLGLWTELSWIAKYRQWQKRENTHIVPRFLGKVILYVDFE